MEDVIEELIGEEIIDETDLYVDVHRRISVARARVQFYRQSSSNPGTAAEHNRRGKHRTQRSKSMVTQTPGTRPLLHTLPVPQITHPELEVSIVSAMVSIVSAMVSIVSEVVSIVSAMVSIVSEVVSQ